MCAVAGGAIWRSRKICPSPVAESLQDDLGAVGMRAESEAGSPRVGGDSRRAGIDIIGATTTGDIG
jgi:hypothetical protein